MGLPTTGTFTIHSPSAVSFVPPSEGSNVNVHVGFSANQWACATMR